MHSRSARLLVAALGLVGALGCAPEAVSLTAADEGRAGALGDDGRFGALLFERTFRVRADEPLAVDVIVPSVDDVEPAAGPFPLVLVVQGGLVSADRYRWLAAHLATRGFVALLPRHALDLAFFSQGDGLDALEAAREASNRRGDALEGRVSSSPAGVIGHSLGGVVATKAWIGAPQAVERLALLSSLPDPADDVSRTSGRVLSIAGGTDARIDAAEVAAGAEAFSASSTVAVVEGVNHYLFTDDATDGELESDGPLQIDAALGRKNALFLVDALFASLAGASQDAVLDDPGRWPAGVVPFAEDDVETDAGSAP